MGKNQTATQSSMEDLLASIRQTIDPEEANNRQQPIQPVSETEGEVKISAMRDTSRKTSSISYSEEILNLRRRIAGNLGGDSRPNGVAMLLGDRPAANSSSEPAQGYKPEFLPAAQGESQPNLRQSLIDSSVSDFVEETVQEPNPQVASWREKPRSSSFPPRPMATAFHDRMSSRDKTLMSDEASTAANAAFGRLAETLMARAVGDRSIEDLTRDLLRTMLKQWLDENLPDLVERIVRDEIERVARRGTRR
jgi:cell pole-organizing protein PopZ